MKRLDELPEWAADDLGGGDEGGTFDSSGAFMSLKDVEYEELEKVTPNGDASSKSNNIHSKPTDRKQVMHYSEFNMYIYNNL